MPAVSNATCARLDPTQIQEGHELEVHNVTRDTLVARRPMLALTSWGRMRGLLARPPLGQDDGMLIRPCRGVHTCFMSYPIDVLFIDRGGQVVALSQNLGPWRLTPMVFRACCVLELAAGQAERTRTQVGDQLAFERLGV
jgi:uncharacterized membrane protein (UPF0127 family)